MTASVGATVYPDDGEHHEVLMRNAIAAAHRSAKAGGNRYTFFTPELKTLATQGLETESILRRAIRDQSVTIHYQPIVSSFDQSLVSVEALVRCDDGEGHLISPNRFIPLAEQTGLRVRPETLCRITEFSEHESNGRELDEGERVAVEVLPVLGQSAAAVEPGDGAFDHPTPGLDDEALHPIGSLDDLGLEIGQDAGQGAVKDRALIGAVGEQFPEKGKQTEQGRQQRETAVAILNVGGGDDAVQQQALRIDQNMPLLALDQLAGIEAVAVDASPPFSALFTL